MRELCLELVEDRLPPSGRHVPTDASYAPSNAVALVAGLLDDGSESLDG